MKEARATEAVKCYLQVAVADNEDNGQPYGGRSAALPLRHSGTQALRHSVIVKEYQMIHKQSSSSSW